MGGVEEPWRQDVRTRRVRLHPTPLVATLCLEGLSKQAMYKTPPLARALREASARDPREPRVGVLTGQLLPLRPRQRDPEQRRTLQDDRERLITPCHVVDSRATDLMNRRGDSRERLFFGGEALRVRLYEVTRDPVSEQLEGVQRVSARERQDLIDDLGSPGEHGGHERAMFVVLERAERRALGAQRRERAIPGLATGRILLHRLLTRRREDQDGPRLEQRREGTKPPRRIPAPMEIIEHQDDGPCVGERAERLREDTARDVIGGDDALAGAHQLREWLRHGRGYPESADQARAHALSRGVCREPQGIIPGATP